MDTQLGPLQSLGLKMMTMMQTLQWKMSMKKKLLQAKPILIHDSESEAESAAPGALNNDSEEIVDYIINKLCHDSTKLRIPIET